MVRLSAVFYGGDDSLSIDHLTALVDFFQNPHGLVRLGRGRLIIVGIGFGGDGTRGDLNLVIFLYTIRSDGESLLENHGVHIAGIGIASKTEISQAVHDVFPLYFSMPWRTWG